MLGVPADLGRRRTLPPDARLSGWRSSGAADRRAVVAQWSGRSGAVSAVRAVRAVRVDVVDRGQRHERRAGGFLDRGGPAGEAIADREHAAHVMALLAQRLERSDRGPAGGDDVLDQHAALVGVELRALDPARQAVALGLL